MEAPRGQAIDQGRGPRARQGDRLRRGRPPLKTTAQALAKQLASKTLDRDKAVAILEQLAAMGEAATPAVAAVIPMLPEHAYDAYGALASMTPAVVAREMVSGLEDPNRRAQMLECFHTLAVHGPSSPDRPVRAFVEELRKIAVEPLIAQLAHEKARRSAVPFALGLVGANDDRAFDTLVGLVDDDDHHVRWSTAHGLKYFGDRAVPHLEKLLDDFGEADTTAVRVLATIGTKPALAVLAKAAKRKDHVGRKAKDELGSIRAEQSREQPSPAKPATKKAKPKKATTKKARTKKTRTKKK